MSEAQRRIDELMAPMLKKVFYVILSRPVDGLAAMMPHLEEHLRWMIDLEKKGVLFASGPFLAHGDESPGTGMTIVRAASREDAEAIAKEDPFVRHGVRTYELRAWQVNEGVVSVSVNFSDCTYGFA